MQTSSGGRAVLSTPWRWSYGEAAPQIGRDAGATHARNYANHRQLHSLTFPSSGHVLEHQQNVDLRLAKLDVLTAWRTGQAGSHVRPRCACTAGGPPPAWLRRRGAHGRTGDGVGGWSSYRPRLGAASWYKVSMAAGMSSVAVTDGVASPPPRSDVMPAPAPAARTATRRTSPAAPVATLLARLVGASSRPVLTPTRAGRWRAGRDVGELGETEPTAVASDREPDGGVGAVPGSRDAEAFETLGAVVVLEEERQARVSFGPDAVAVGADDLTPLSGTAPFRPPLVEPATGSGASRSEQGAEEPFRPTR